MATHTVIYPFTATDQSSRLGGLLNRGSQSWTATMNGGTLSVWGSNTHGFPWTGLYGAKLETSGFLWRYNWTCTRAGPKRYYVLTMHNGTSGYSIYPKGVSVSKTNAASTTLSQQTSTSNYYTSYFKTDLDNALDAVGWDFNDIKNFRVSLWLDSWPSAGSTVKFWDMYLQVKYSLPDLTFTVEPNNSEYGSASLSVEDTATKTTKTGTTVTFENGSEATFTATPKTGYVFQKWVWNNGSSTSTSNPRTITVNTTSNFTYTANFRPAYYTVTCNASPSQGGSVTMTNPDEYINTSGTRYSPWNTTDTFTATPNSHYHFARWVRTRSSSDGLAATKGAVTTSTSNLYTQVVDGSADVVAVFELDQHTVTLTSNDTTQGTVTGGGTYDYGSQIIITATPIDANHTFTMWSDGSTTATRTITVTGDISLTATFAEKLSSVVLIANNSNYGTVSGGGTKRKSEQYTVTATPAAGYRFVAWHERYDGVDSYMAEDNPFTFSAWADNITLVAIFEPIPEEPTSNIYIGDQQIQQIYLGATPVEAIYIGTTKVF